MSPRTLAILFPDGQTQFWLTKRVFAIGDKLNRDGKTWIVTSLGNFDRNGKALAITLRLDGDTPA